MDSTQPSTVTLDRLLNRLSFNLTSPDGAAKLRSSRYDRTRTGANLEHARAMLLTLEKQTSSIRAPAQRQQFQAHLQQQREQLQSLHTHLRELDRSDDESSSDDSEGEDLLSTYGPARRDADSGIEAGEGANSLASEIQQATHELRARRPQASTTASASVPTATTTATPTPVPTSSARDQLFAGRPSQDLSLQTSETLMTHHRTEQEALTSGLLALASALKASSQNFAASLEAEKDVLKRAEGGLDKSASGMQAAEKKMSMLRRMSEGQGWWGRIKLYGFIAGLWVACFLLVFVGPKLRF